MSLLPPSLEARATLACFQSGDDAKCFVSTEVAQVEGRLPNALQKPRTEDSQAYPTLAFLGPQLGVALHHTSLDLLFMFGGIDRVALFMRIIL